MAHLKRLCNKLYRKRKWKTAHQSPDRPFDPSLTNAAFNQKETTNEKITELMTIDFCDKT